MFIVYEPNDLVVLYTANVADPNYGAMLTERGIQYVEIPGSADITWITLARDPDGNVVAEVSPPAAP